MESLAEFTEFLRPSQRLDLKSVALTHILGLTGSSEGKAAILSHDNIIVALFNLTTDVHHVVAKDAVLCLINITAEEDGALKVYELAKNSDPPFHIVCKAIEIITDENAELADAWTMVLSNISRVESIAHDILNELNPKDILKMVKAFTKLDYNKKKNKLDYLGPIFCNLTQTGRGREIICLDKYNLIDKILPFASFQDSLIRRGGTIGILKNICFDPVYHDIILRDPDDILCALLYPLCGPEEFSDEENDMLPIDLQFLPETKTREEDPDLRKMLLESLLQLCSRRKSREHLRSKGVYEILREYHKWEAKIAKNKECLLACENVVDILIKKEDEIGLDNYKQVDVPQDVAEKFLKEDEEYLKDL
ncbi:protein HGH1 homolog [Musca domestica]|uniref:Protein HGH1 homolog n=2 Tax=Musca domestica TaxID=7370 RepID=A0A1I8MEY4_MUSDO|nr:protein HGH1 homolog [Musca domestica]